jgi:hypothetical protein
MGIRRGGNTPNDISAVIHYVLSVSSRPTEQVNYSQDKIMLTISSCMFRVTIRPGLSGHVLFIFMQLTFCPVSRKSLTDLQLPSPDA